MSRFVPVLLCGALLASACTSSVTVEAGDESGGVRVVPAQPSSTSTSTIDPTTIPGTRPEAPPIERTTYLLTQEDLPDWTYVRAMDFGAEPTFEAVGCKSMDVVWGPHGQAGTRIRASIEGFAIRQTVVEMADEAAAESVIDAADLVWLECNPLTMASGSEWWVEPIQVPEVEGWNSVGLAFGMPDGLIWSIAWFQQGSTVVFVDVDSENPWSKLDTILRSAGARLKGDSVPVAVNEAPPTTSAPTTPPSTFASVGWDWEDHPAAAYIPEPELFGAGFSQSWGDIQEGEPSDPNDDIEGCEVDAPPTMDGVKVVFENETETAEVELLIGIDNSAWAQDTVDAFRAVAACGAEALEVDEITLIEVDNLADDALALDITAVEGTMRGLVVIARYGNVMVSLYYGWEAGSTTEPPSVETLVDWVEVIAELN